MTVLCSWPTAGLASPSQCGGHLGRLFVLPDGTGTIEVEPGMIECRRDDGRWYEPRRFASTAAQRKIRRHGIPGGIGARPIQASDAKRRGWPSGRLRAEINAEQSLIGARLATSPLPAVRGDRDPMVDIQCPRCERWGRADLTRLLTTEGVHLHHL